MNRELMNRKNNFGKKPFKGSNNINTHAQLISCIRYLEGFSGEQLVDKIVEKFNSIIASFNLQTEVSFQMIVNLLAKDDFLRGLKQYKVRFVLSQLAENAYFYKLLKDLLKQNEQSQVFENCLKILVKMSQFKRETADLLPLDKIEEAATKFQEKETVTELHQVLLSLKAFNLEETKQLEFKAVVGDKERTLTFRTKTILPTFQEMFDSQFDIYKNLVPNLVDASWPEDYGEVYLDTQFNLLRVDYISPFKEALDAWFQNLKKRQRSVIWNMKFKKFNYSNHRKPTVIISNSEKLVLKDNQFIPGSLVALFVVQNRVPIRESMIFGVIVSTREEGIELNIPTNFLMNLSLEASYALVESPCYFLSVEPILNWIKNVKWEDISLRKAILTGKISNQIPNYLQDCHVDVKPLLTSPVSVNDNPITFLESEYDDHICLDPSQKEAMKRILGTKISLVVGPPGTGKSYIGIKACQIIRRCLDFKGIKNPILVVCYTNHALDQVLEDLTDDMPLLVRCGSRSKSENEILLSRNIQNIVGRATRSNSEIWKVKNTITYLNDQHIFLQECFSKLKTDDLSGFLPDPEWACLLKPLAGFLNKHEHENSSFLDSIKKEYFASWKSGNLEQFFDKWKKKLAPKPKFHERKDKQEIKLSNQFDALVVDDMEGIEYNSDSEDEDSALEKVEKRKLEKQKEKEQNLVLLEDEDEIMYEEKDEDLRLVDSAGNSEAIDFEDSSRDSVMQHVCNLLLLFFDTNIPDFDDFSKMGAEERAIFLISLKERIKEILEEERVNIIEKMDEEEKKLKELNDSLIYEHCKDVPVIGMTSTYASLHRELIDKLSPYACVIEEAGELLESQTLACLSSRNLQHLIMIGDYQQLRPKVNDYKLAKEFKLDISMFERLVNLNIRYSSLKTQQRMRTEICDLVRPFYDDLQDHPRVLNYPDVKGVAKNVYFIDHVEIEDNENNEDILSKRNSYEAEYSVHLCDYLLKQGYKSEEITILTPYLGQKRLIRQFCKEKNINCIVSTVDDYQGEENSIVILSLVRSNSVCKSGFVAVENRTIVSLSRAKIGCYIIGNGGQISTTKAWRDVINHLKSHNQFGKAIPLVCQNHPKITNYVKKVQDFMKVLDGGCSEKCGVGLPCGHVCPYYCHPPRNHDKIVCNQLCERTICEHQCPNLCSNCNTHTLSTCKRLVRTQLPCGHTKNVECGLKNELEKIRCEEKVEIQLACYHSKKVSCFEKDQDTRCTFVRDMKGECGHTVKMICRQFQPCTQKCDQRLDCLHKCPKNCRDGAHSHERKSCEQPCEKELLCGHKCKENCGNENHTQRCTEKCNLGCKHAKCKLECYKPCVPCSKKCNWCCQHFRCGKLCSEECDRPRCNRRCKKPLKCCGRRCRGLCGEICPPCIFCTNKKLYCPLSMTDLREMDARDKLYMLPDCKCVFNVELLDGFMDTETVNGNHVAIAFKKCPTCQTPILNSARYSNVIKKVKRRMEAVKRAMEEMDEIVEAMKKDINATYPAAGRWFACPNNHPYFISDCGGPQQISKCPECKETIGGSGHSIVPGNRFRSDIDGAKGTAWPTAMNNAARN